MVSTAVDPRAFDHRQTTYVPPAGAYVPPCTPPHAHPNQQWRQAFLASFSDLRATVARAVAAHGDDGGGGGTLPFGMTGGEGFGGGGGGTGSGGWETGKGGGSAAAAASALTEASEAALACCRRHEQAEGGNEEEGQGGSVGCTPSLSQLLGVDDVTAAALLRRHGIAMEEDLRTDSSAGVIAGSSRAGSGTKAGAGAEAGAAEVFGTSQTRMQTHAPWQTRGDPSRAQAEQQAPRHLTQRRAAWFFALSARVVSSKS